MTPLLKKNNHLMEDLPFIPKGQQEQTQIPCVSCFLTARKNLACTTVQVSNGVLVLPTQNRTHHHFEP